MRAEDGYGADGRQIGSDVYLICPAGHLGAEQSGMYDGKGSKETRYTPAETLTKLFLLT